MNRRESMRKARHRNTNDRQKKYRLGTVSKNILLDDLNPFHGANLALNSDVDQDTFGKVTKHKKTQHTRHQCPLISTRGDTVSLYRSFYPLVVL